MATLSQDAQGHLERYLRQIKAALRGHASVDPNEVQRDVLGHIEAELAGQPEPIGASRLREVLDRLGRPDEWVTASHSPGREARPAIESWAQDWRLAYLTFGLFVAGPVLFLAGPFLWPLEPGLFAASFVFARVELAILAERDEDLGTRRWLIYPPLLICSVAAAIVLFLWPVAPVGAFLGDLRTWRRLVDSGFTQWQIDWIVWVERRHAWRVVLAGLLLLIASATVVLVWR